MAHYLLYYLLYKCIEECNIVKYMNINMIK